jgi:hypothetical protein
MNGGWYIAENEWNTIHKKVQDTTRVWIKNNMEDLIEKIFEIEWKEEYDKYASGDILQWELDSLNFYHSGHPLDGLKCPLEIAKLDELKENDFDGYFNIKGNAIPKMNLKLIMGTVLVANKKSNIVVLSCPDGVMRVKCYKVQYAKYDKVLEDDYGDVIQESFFEKGSHICVSGFLRDGMFIPKVYGKGSDPITRLVFNELNMKECIGLEEKE